MNQLSDAEVAINAAEAGAAVVRAKYGAAISRYDKSPTDFATEADLGVVRGTSGTSEHPVYLLAEVALDFEDKAANLALGIACLPAEELVGVREHAR